MSSKREYDILTFNSYRDIEDKLKWFDRMHNVLIAKIVAIESAINSFEDPEDKNPDISHVLRYMENRKGSGDTDMDSDENVKPPLILSAFHETPEDEIPNLKDIFTDNLDNYVRIYQIINKIRTRIRDLKTEIYLEGRAVILITEPFWWIFGTRYLFSLMDAKEFFLMKGELDISFNMFGFYDPYNASVYGSTFGNVSAATSTM